MTEFQKRCYALLQQIPVGRVTTYGELSRALNTKAYQAIGQAMKCNPNPVVVPCHRVVKSCGDIGGYAYGVEKKIALLEAEGVSVEKGKVVDFEQRLFRFENDGA